MTANRSRRTSATEKFGATMRFARTAVRRDRLHELRDRFWRDATRADDAVDAVDRGTSARCPRRASGEVKSTATLHVRVGKRLEPVGYADRDRITARDGRDVIADAGSERSRRRARGRARERRPAHT
jgi:hypothetical protein